MSKVDPVDRAALMEQLPQICDELNGCSAPYDFDEHCLGCEVYTLHKLLADAPTIDSVPVVRCKDCVLRGNESCPMAHNVWDGNLYGDGEFVTIDKTVDDGFCHMGRMENETEQ